MSSNPSHNEALDRAKQRIEQLEKDTSALEPEKFETEFEVEEDLGADYYRKFSRAFQDFCSTFQLDAHSLSIVEEDKLGGNYMSQSQNDDTLIVFKLTNRFPPLAEQKSAQLDIVVAQNSNQHIPSKFNLRFTHKQGEDSFKVNCCTVIVLDKQKLPAVLQKSKFWISMANL